MVYNLYKISFDFIQYPFNIYKTVNPIYFINYCNHQSTNQYLSIINPIKVNPTRNSYVWTHRGELTHLNSISRFWSRFGQNSNGHSNSSLILTLGLIPYFTDTSHLSIRSHHSQFRSILIIHDKVTN